MDNKFFEATRNLTDEEYLKLLCRAENEPIIDGVRMPGFPDESIQNGTVGSAGALTIKGEGRLFYQIVKEYAGKLGVPITPDSTILDFGCGWGRMIRFYFKDIKSENIFGTDVDPMLVDICKNTLPCGNYLVNVPAPPTNFEDNFVDIVYAYSVFSHLKYDIAEEWIKEFSRILKPGGILVATTQGEGFFDYIQNLKRNPGLVNTLWHEFLVKSFDPIDEYRERYKKGEFLYAATGGGEVRDSSFYGEAFLPKQYIEKHFEKYMRLVDFFYDTKRLPQALFVMQKQ